MDKGYDYYIVEAFDQPWKAGNEGAVGAYWGLFDAHGDPKFRFHRHAALVPGMADLHLVRRDDHAAARLVDPGPDAAGARSLAIS